MCKLTIHTLLPKAPSPDVKHEILCEDNSVLQGSETLECEFELWKTS